VLRLQFSTTMGECLLWLSSNVGGCHTRLCCTFSSTLIGMSCFIAMQ
jgi:hypothetical protein